MLFTFYFFIFLFGAAIGSFLNVVIMRLPAGKSIVKDRSHCPHCKHTLGVLDLIPIFSFIFLRGKCRYCHKKIVWQYFLIELFVGLFFVFLAQQYLLINNFANIFFYRDAIFFCALLVVFAIDLEHFLIFDSVVLPLCIVAFAFNLAVTYQFQGWEMAMLKYLGAGIFGAGFFGFQYFVSKGKWVGGGDLRLGLLMGLMLGWPKVLLALFIAYVGGALISVVLLSLKKKKMGSEMPMGAFLAPATVIVLLFGDIILQWYYRLY